MDDGGKGSFRWGALTWSLRRKLMSSHFLFRIRCKLKFQLLKEQASFLPFPGPAASIIITETKQSIKSDEQFSVKIKQSSLVRCFSVSDAFYMIYPLA